MASLKSMDMLQIQNLTQESLVAQELLTFTSIIEVTLWLPSAITVKQNMLTPKWKEKKGNAPLILFLPLDFRQKYY